MVGIGGVVADVDGAVGVIDVTKTIEAGVEGAGEVSVAVVDRRRQPALGVIAQLIGEKVMADQRAGAEPLHKQARTAKAT